VGARRIDFVGHLNIRPTGGVQEKEQAMYEHYDRILSERQSLLSQFQSPFHQSNCPAVAAAVQRFLETGIVRRARDVASGFGCEDSGMPFTRTDLPGLLATVQAGGHGFQVVAGASDAATHREHYANIVNIHGAVYYVDAYTRPGVISAPNDIASWLSWASELEFTRNYQCRLVPV
jgi:hypothetical protein